MTDRLPGLKFTLFALVCLAAAVWVASVTGNLDRIPCVSDTATYEAVLEEATGLAVGDDVRLAGVAVGRVDGIRLERGNAVVEFHVDRDVQPTTTWQVGARWRNVIGQRYLYLYEQPGGIALADGDRIPVERAIVTADVGRFFNEITPLLQALDPAEQNRLVDALNTTLLGREETIQSLVANLAGLSGDLASLDPEIRSLIDHANLLLAEYNAREDELLQFIDSLAEVSDTLAARNDEVIGAAVDLADVQAQLADLIAANDEGLRDVVGDVEAITAEIGEDRAWLDAALGSTRQGFATYMLISRWGEWFNVRAVAIQVQQGGQVISCLTETGSACHAPNSATPPQGGPLPGLPGLPASGGLPDPGDLPVLGDLLSSGEGGAPVALEPSRHDALEVVAGAPLRSGGEGR